MLETETANGPPRPNPPAPHSPTTPLTSCRMARSATRPETRPAAAHCSETGIPRCLGQPLRPPPAVSASPLGRPPDRESARSRRVRRRTAHSPAQRHIRRTASSPRSARTSARCLTSRSSSSSSFHTPCGDPVQQLGIQHPQDRRRPSGRTRQPTHPHHTAPTHAASQPTRGRHQPQRVTNTDRTR